MIIAGLIVYVIGWLFYVGFHIERKGPWYVFVLSALWPVFLVIALGMIAAEQSERNRP